jgi:glutaconate CoA-transferase subunit B
MARFARRALLMTATSLEEMPSSWSRTGSVGFLVRAAEPFRRGGWVFTGFHWPVLAGSLGSRLNPDDLVQVYEAGAACNATAGQIPTSTTDVYAYADAQCVRMTSADVLLALMRRFDCAVLDATNVDVFGRINSTAIGPIRQPTVRLPGGGGSSDVMARAAHVVLLHGGSEPGRIVATVEHVTATPRRNQFVQLITRWGVLELGQQPSLRSIVDGLGTDEFLAHLTELGIDVGSAQQEDAITSEDALAAMTVLQLASERGYRVARQAMQEAMSWR